MTTFKVSAVSANRVRIIFSEPMMVNAALTNPACYLIHNMSGVPATVGTVTPEQATNVRSVLLALTFNLVPGRLYQVRLTSLSSATSQPVKPDRTVLQWFSSTLSTQVPVDHFSGVVPELEGIFFSPALQSPASNSVIQIEAVEVCSRAYDEYQIPQPVAVAQALTTHGGLLPLPITRLNIDVLWQQAQNIEARVELAEKRLDALPVPTEGPAKATLTEIWPIQRVSLLNSTWWGLYAPGNSANFSTADNSTAFPPAAAPVFITL